MGLNGTGHARLHRGTVLGFATAAVAGPVVRRSPDLELVGACDGTVTAPWSTTLTRREQRAMVPPIASPGGPRRPPGNVENLGGEWISLRPVSLIGSGLDAHLAAFDKRSRRENPSSICRDRWLQPCWRSLQFAVSGRSPKLALPNWAYGNRRSCFFRGSCGGPCSIMLRPQCSLNAHLAAGSDRHLGFLQRLLSHTFHACGASLAGKLGEEGRMRGYLDLLKRMTIRAPQDPERHPLYLARAWGVAAGSLILLCACLYRRIKHPDWTGGQAVAVLWPVYIIGAFSICSGWLFRDANKTLRTPAALAGKAGIVSRLDPSP